MNTTTKSNDEAKVRTLEAMAVSLTALSHQMIDLAELDDESFTTGRYDLRDQLVTMRKRVQDLTEAWNRARNIVPVTYWTKG